MRQVSYVNLVVGAERKRLADGTTLRILSAMEVLEARREAEALCKQEEELALCSNACILARAWEKGQKACYGSGEELLQSLSVTRIQELAHTWAQFEREENPGLSASEERIEALKKAWSTRLMSAFAGVCSAVLGRFRPRSA